MSAAVALRSAYGANDLRRLAGRARDGGQARRLMALALVAEGKSREAAAAIGLMDRQTLRDWVHRFNAEGPGGLIDRKSPGRPAKLSAAQKEDLRKWVEAGPETERPDLVRWRRADLADLLKERFDVECHETTVGRMLRGLGFSHISARARHPEKDDDAQEAFKKALFSKSMHFSSQALPMAAFRQVRGDGSRWIPARWNHLR
jgi:transposase